METVRSDRCYSRFLPSIAGSSAVEFALLSPLFILLMMAIAGYGIYFGASHSVQQIAADAARTAIAGLTAAERQQLASNFIARNAGSYAFVDPAKLTVTTRDSAVDGSQFVVALSYDARNLPIWNLLDRLPMPDTTITRNATIRIGGI